MTKELAGIIINGKEMFFPFNEDPDGATFTFAGSVYSFNALVKYADPSIVTSKHHPNRLAFDLNEFARGEGYTGRWRNLSGYGKYFAQHPKAGRFVARLRDPIDIYYANKRNVQLFG